MKRLPLLLSVCAAVLTVAAKPKKLSDAEIAKQDKANWGGVDYSAAPDGENSVANDLAQIRSMSRGEAAKMKKLYDSCDSILHGAKILDVEPESLLADARKQLGRPIDPTPPRVHSNNYATPAQKLGFKSLQGAKRAFGKFGKDVRPKMADLLQAEIETKLFSSYNRLVRVVTLNVINDGSLVKSFKKVDTAWGKYLKILDKIAKGSGKWQYYPWQLLNSEKKKQLFAEVLKESGLDCAIDANGSIQPKSSRVLHALDGYFERATDADLKKFSDGIDRCYAAHNTAADALNEFNRWFAETGMSIDPYPRETMKELLLGHSEFVHKNREIIEDSQKVLKTLKSSSSNAGKLRQCKDFSPNGAFFLKAGKVTNGKPNYAQRMEDLVDEAKKRFEEAVKTRIATTGRIQI